MLSTKPLDIRADHAEIIHKILKDNLEEVTYVFAFGSRTNWTAKQSSDLDLAIDSFGVKLDKKIKSNLEDAFEESDLPYKVDVVDLNSVSESFREAIKDQLVRVLWDWRTYKLGEIVEFINDKVSIDLVNVRTYISTDNMLPDCAGIEEAKSLPNAKTVNGFVIKDVLFSNIRTYFRKVWLATFSGTCSPDVVVIRSKNFDLLDQKFLFRVVCSDEFIEYSVRTAKGVKMPRGDKDALKVMSITLPPLPEQKRIAEILSSLDNKIEINKQINKTLVEMAEALFKSWFIDFDPVRVKKAALEAGADEKEANLAVMRFISSKTEEELEKFRDDYPEKWRELEDVAKLFPAEFQDSELGEVPLGWEVKMLGDIGTIVTGTTPDKSDWTIDGDIPFITPSDFGYNNYFLLETIRYVSEKLKSTILSRFIPANSILVTCIGSDMGKVTINTRECLTNQQINSIIPNKHYSGNESFLYFMLKHKRTFLRSIAEAGSTMPIINKTQFSRVKILVPHNSLLSIFKKRNLENNRLIKLSLQQTSNLMLVNNQLRNKLLIGEAIIYKNHKKALMNEDK
jgi:type I restriction enzyme S subunit